MSVDRSIQHQEKLIDIKEKIVHAVDMILDGDVSALWFLLKLLVIGCCYYLLEHPFQGISGYFFIMLMVQRWRRSVKKTEIRAEEVKKAKAERLVAESKVREQMALEQAAEDHKAWMRKNTKSEGLDGTEPGLQKPHTDDTDK